MGSSWNSWGLEIAKRFRYPLLSDMDWWFGDLNWREAEDPQMVLPGSVDPELTQVLTSGARLCRRSLGRHVTGLGLVQCGCVVGYVLVGLASGWLMARLEFQRWVYGWFRACLRRRPNSQKSRNRPNTSGKNKSNLIKKPEKP